MLHSCSLLSEISRLPTMLVPRREANRRRARGHCLLRLFASMYMQLALSFGLVCILLLKQRLRTVNYEEESVRTAEHEFEQWRHHAQ